MSHCPLIKTKIHLHINSYTHWQLLLNPSVSVGWELQNVHEYDGSYTEFLIWQFCMDDGLGLRSDSLVRYMRNAQHNQLDLVDIGSESSAQLSYQVIVLECKIFGEVRGCGEGIGTILSNAMGKVRWGLQRTIHYYW